MEAKGAEGGVGELEHTQVEILQMEAALGKEGDAHTGDSLAVLQVSFAKMRQIDADCPQSCICR